jgi:hypothetical protein
VTEIDITEVDRDLLGVGNLGSLLVHAIGHNLPVAIQVDGLGMLFGY